MSRAGQQAQSVRSPATDLLVRVWIGSTRSQGIAVNLQKNVFLIIGEF